MAISINSDDKAWVTSLFTAFAGAIAAADADIKNRADIVAGNTAAQAVS